MEGWEQTLGDLFAERGAALKRRAFLLCGDDAEADDLVQEALVRAFGRPLRVPRPGGAEAYVRTIMVNLFIDGTRRQTRWRRVAPLLRPAGQAPDVAEQVSARDAVLGALRGLPPRQRACVVLRFTRTCRSQGSPGHSAWAKARSSGISARRPRSWPGNCPATAW